MKILALIVTYNSQDDIEKCLNSLLKSTASIDLLIIDNNSSDSTVEIVKKYKQVKLIETKRNLGYAGGNNVGLDYGLSSGYKYIFLANPDLTIEPGTIESLVSEAERSSKAALLSPLVTNARKGGEVWYAGSNIDWKTGLTPHASIGLKPVEISRKPFITDRACGAAMLIRVGALSKVGLLPEEYFLYYEEADWSQVFVRAGYQVLVVPEAVAHHNVSASTGEESPLVWYYMVRNRLYFVKKLNTKHAASAEECVRKEIKKNLLAWLRNPSRTNLSRAKAVMKGYIDYKKGRMGKGW